MSSNTSKGIGTGRMRMPLKLALFGLVFLFAVVLLSAEADAADIVVDGAGNGDYTTIGDAIDNSSDDDTIYIWDGTYVSPGWSHQITSEITIIGNGTSGVTVECAVSYGFVIKANNVAIKNLAINYSNFGGVHVVGYHYLLIDNVHFYNASTPTVLQNSHHSTIKNCYFRNILGGSAGAIWFNIGSKFGIIENNLVENAYIGIEARGSNITLKDNVIYNCSSTGIYLVYCDNITLGGNIIHNSTRGIDMPIVHSSTIKDTHISNCERGMWLHYNTDNNSIYYNTIENCTIGMEFWDHLPYAGIPINNQIYNNNFIDNAVHAFCNYTNVWNLSTPTGGNYWDNWTSPDVDADGFVDNNLVINVSAGNVDEYPWTTRDGWFIPKAKMALPDVPEQGWDQEIMFSAAGTVHADWYLWDFGDGTTLNTTDVGVVHTYAHPGTKDVVLTVGNLTSGRTDGDTYSLSVDFSSTADEGRYQVIETTGMVNLAVAVAMMALIAKIMLNFTQETMEEGLRKK